VQGSLSDGELLKLPMTVNAAGFSLVNETTHPGALSASGRDAQ
jgi:hypothetical protein